MGYYIETLHPKGKAKQLVDVHGAELVLSPDKFDFNGPDALICVVENPLFDAAAIVYNAKERNEFLMWPGDTRERTWLKLPKSLVKQLNPRAPL